MSKSALHIFGDPSTFAISVRSVPGERRMIHCNLMLNGDTIGNPDSADMLGTCIGDLQRLRDRVMKHKGHFRSALFDGLTDNEVMELVYKSNQPEEEFDPAYAHLPQQPTNDLWYQHTITLAETTDPYAIIVFEEKGKLKFLWQKWQDKEKNLRSAIVEYEVFRTAVRDFLNFVSIRYSAS